MRLTDVRGVFQIFAAGPARQRFVNVGHLLSGNMVTLVLSFGAVALTARTLGPTQYGMLALIISFAQAMEMLVSFQTWQPVIRFGAGLEEAGRDDDFAALCKFGFLLDFSAAAASWIVALALMLAAGQFYGWSGEIYTLILIYSATLLFKVNGAPVGILRLTGRFRSVAYLQAVSMAVRLSLCVVAFLQGAGMLTFVLIWASTQILGSLLLIATSLRELARRGLKRVFHARVAGITERFPGIWGFTWSTNFSLTLWSSAQQLDTLLVGALADPAGAGLYHIAKRISKTFLQAGAQLQAVVYPEIARLWNTDKLGEFRRVVLQSEFMLAAFGLAAWAFIALFAGPLIRAFVGPEFAAAAPLLIVQMFAVTLALTSSIKRAALMSMGQARQLFVAVLVVVPIFHASAILLIPRMGPMGANLAHLIMATLWIIVLHVMFRRAFQRGSDGGSPSIAKGTRNQPLTSEEAPRG
ncbi:lipopolysaccharide biosynthesis protein [Sphingomonas cavernae]|uniref:Lipopolysaccharide biosynthesis protein n=1 Tax=Sphingomonas cavernae TaxID=2320861 RepID=A0A418WRK1_9SPHN|nr:oligosaccharide flippase family protein [Sphingomonas cavernae]RJF93888.1 lipopolysaccharide biosynthesis protein [Sphingomonas cavernae]